MTFLGEVPLLVAVRRSADEGTPIVVAEPDGAAAVAYEALAAAIRSALQLVSVPSSSTV